MKIPPAQRDEVPPAPVETPAQRVLRLFRSQGSHPWVEINTNSGAGATRTLRWGFGVTAHSSELIAEANELRQELVAELEREDASGQGDPLSAVRLCGSLRMMAAKGIRQEREQHARRAAEHAADRDRKKTK